MTGGRRVGTLDVLDTLGAGRSGIKFDRPFLFAPPGAEGTFHVEHEHEMLDNLIHHIGKFAVALLRRRLGDASALTDIIADQLEECIRYAHKQLTTCEGNRDSDPPPAGPERLDPSVDHARTEQSALIRPAPKLSPTEFARQQVAATRRFKTQRRRLRGRRRR